MCLFSNLVHIPKIQDGWGQSATRFLAECPENLLGIHWCRVICFQNCTGGQSAIWLQKVIWQFIFGAALLPATCFKLNLWHKDIHHFNCMLLFSQALICFIFFFLFSLGRRLLFWFFFFRWSTITKKKSKTYFPESNTFYSQGVYSTELSGFFWCGIFGS